MIMDGEYKTDSTSRATPVVTTNDVESRMIVLRGQPVLIDADVAGLYGVQTKEVNNNLKFSTVMPIAFTERGLYMLATILKGSCLN